MKKFLTVVIALASVNAFATRSRLTSMGNSPHIMDTQRVYTNPSDIMMFNDFLDIESGSTSSAKTDVEYTNADGLLTRSINENSKLGFSVGHRAKNGSAWGLRKILAFTAADTSVSNQQNPLELTYGAKASDMNWGVTVVYDNYNDKKNNEKEEAGGFRAGMRMGAWDFTWQQGLINKVKKEGSYDYKASAGSNFLAGYTMGDYYFYSKGTYADAKVDVTSGTLTYKLKQEELSLGVVDSMKKDGYEFYYGASLYYNKMKSTFPPAAALPVANKYLAGETTTTQYSIPLVMGFEVPATTWMQVRASITQDVLLSNIKTVPTSGSNTKELAPGANTTVASAGLGFTLGKVQLDGNLSGLTGSTATQALDGNTFLTQVGMTYMF